MIESTDRATDQVSDHASESAEWVYKLNLECINEKDGSLTLSFTWDETDPDLDYWNNLGEEGQKKLIMDVLYDGFENLGITTDDT